MHSLSKTLSLLISLSLLAQSTLFAAPASANSPQNLAEYQRQAREDVAQAPWIKKEGKYILGIGGTAVGLLIVQQLYHEAQVKAINKQYGKMMYDLTQQHELQLHNTKVLANSYNKIAQTLEAENRTLKKQLQTSLAQRQRQENNIHQMHNRIEQMRQEQNQLQRRFDQKKKHYTDLVHYSKELDVELAKYEKLFSSTATDAEVLALRKQLAKEPWLLKVTPQQRDEFLYIIDQASQYRRGTYREAGDSFMRHLIRRSMEKNIPFYERLIGMCRHVFHSKNLVTVGIIVALGMSAHSVKAQKMADRINTNFDLFLNATPAELAEMEKDPAVREVCIQGAEALHQMSQLDEQETEELLQSIRQPVSVPVNGSRGTIQLAR